MRFSFSSLRNLLPGLAMVSLISVGAASAQSLAGVNTRLVKPLDSKSATVGETVAVRLDGSVKTPDGVKLPRGTELVGKVAEVKPSQNGGPASVSLVFTTAELKGGKQIPVKATVVGAFPADEDTAQAYDAASMSTVANEIPADRAIDQEPGSLPGITLKAAVKDSDSGTFSKADGNFKLVAGTFLQVGVAPAAAAGSTNAAE